MTMYQFKWLHDYLIGQKKLHSPADFRAVCCTLVFNTIMSRDNSKLQGHHIYTNIGMYLKYIRDFIEKTRLFFTIEHPFLVLCCSSPWAQPLCY